MTDEQIQAQLTVRDQLIGNIAPIATDEERQQANALRLRVKGWLDQFAALEGEICDPIYKAWRNAKDRFKQGRAPAEKFLEALDNELRADRLRQQQAIAAEQARQNRLAEKRFERAQKSGRGTPLPIPVAPIVQDTSKRIETDEGAVVWVDNWVPHIVDESLIPREYLMPDMAKLKAAAKASIEVPGVRRVNEPFQRARR